MKTILFFLVLTLISINTYSQVAYYDAIALRRHVVFDSTKIPDPPPAVTWHYRGLRFQNDTLNSKNILGILSKYTDSVNNVNFHVDTRIVNSFALNPFISKYLPGAPASGVSIPSSLTNSIGNINVSSLADGVTKFLIKRAKDELFISVISKLQDSTAFPEFVILFPNTMALMKSFNSWEYSNVTNTLKEAFDKDLQQLLADIPKLNTLALNPKLTYSKEVKERVNAIKDFFNSAEARVYIAAMQIGNGVITGEKMPDIIHTIAGAGYLSDIPNCTPDVHNAIRLFDIISYSLRSNVNGTNYISAANFTALINDPVLRNLYFGLLYAQLKNENIQFASVNIANVINTDYHSTAAYIDSLISKSSPLDNAMASLSNAKKKGEKDLTTYWSAIFESANQFLQSSTDISLIDLTLKFPPQIQNAVNYSTQTIAIAHDIAIRNYSATIVGLNTFIPTTEKDAVFKEFFIKYGSFAANIVEAQNSDDVESAIESVALPVGSYTIKQKSMWNISLNGYVGYALDFNAGVSHGIYAPIGFSGSWGLSEKRNLGAVTIFASFIDVGNLVSYRLANDSLATFKQDIRLESIISPSAQVFYEIPTTPISVGCGWRRTPKLFYSSNTGFTTIQPRSVFNVSVLIDIPILTLHNAPFKE